ncbi:IS5 family transposase [Salipiger aestuarii]|uniref:IS5 family transposase n=1 Tax=Salipiger aestuarii TaxID=568098 RepID=UPI0037C6C98B
MSRWPPTKHKTKTWSSYNDGLKRRGSLSIWFDPEMVWVPPPNGKRGRQQQFSDAAIQTCLTLKVLFGTPLRQTTGFVQSLLRLVGLDWAVPDFSTLCRRQRTQNVSLRYRGGSGPLNLLIDSTGLKSEGEGEWNARKHPSHRNFVSTAGQRAAPNVASGARYTSIARQANGTFAERGIDEETLEVRAVEVTTSNVGDAPILPELLDQIAADQDIRTVTADGACDTRKCHDAIAACGAHAVIPPRKNAKPCKPTSAGAIARNEAVNALRYLGRAIWRR